LLGACAAFFIVLAPWWSAREESSRSFPGFVLPPQASAAESEPLFATTEINPQSTERKAHSGTFTQLPDGTLAAAWYAGSGEGAKDVAIQFSLRGTAGTWSPPRRIFGRADLSAFQRRHVLSVGNPLLFTLQNGRLGLLFASIAAGKWSGSSLNWCWSDDRGATWSSPQKLTLNPLANLSALPRNPPSALVGGGWAVPVYEEFLGRFPEVLWLRPVDTVRTAAVTRMDDGMSVFQPSMVPLSRDAAVAFCRDDSGSGRVSVSRSSDRGKTWSEHAATVLPNVDSGVCALRLPDGRLLCAVNDSADRKRENLRLALSGDGGVSWRYIATLAEELGGEFSYPYMVLGTDGRVRMLYSARQNRIVYAEFNTAWIDAEAVNGREVLP
ncbi:MAG: hypothetical protein RIQ71_2698, partial [Verrucomicrobiota bacterium]